MQAIVIFSLVIVLIIFFSFIVYKKVWILNNSTFVQSESDGNYYRVKNDELKQARSNVLGELNKKILQVIDLASNEEYKEEFDTNIRNLNNRYNPNNMMENIDNVGTSYISNKGEEFVMCLSNKSNGDIHDINLLTFVALHEVTHIGCKTYDHGEEFKNFFSYLLYIAEKNGIYTRIDFKRFPRNFCGLNINS